MGRVHSTRVTRGGLVCNNHVGAALTKEWEHDADNEALHLARAANMVRRDVFKMKQAFSCSFDTHCQKESVALLALVYMVLYGPNITTQSSFVFMPQPALTLYQLLMHISLVRSQDQETPLPIYLGIMIHTKTHQRVLVDTLFDLHFICSRAGHLHRIWKQDLSSL